jgi:CRISPR/Cas system CMR-associated protein Cmr3 (group 5 of RAMP superfamily)
MGGQGGIVSRRETDIDINAMFPAPKVTDEGEVFVRWTLISPALFRQTGWMPGWCKDSRKNTADPKPLGTVMFPGCEGCRLVGACAGKPIFFSGWDMKSGIKPTVLAVPQGSAYLFKCDGKVSAEALIARLHLQRQSDDGPKGFGIGVCSLITPTAVGQSHDK